MIALWIFLSIIGFVISLVILYFIIRFMTFRIATWVNIANTQYEDSLKKGTPNKNDLDENDLDENDLDENDLDRWQKLQNIRNSYSKTSNEDKEVKSIRDEKVKTVKELEDEIGF
jgi:uncharacterized membrane protein YgaE (UPF0421/DUF939 family)